MFDVGPRRDREHASDLIKTFLKSEDLKMKQVLAAIAIWIFMAVPTVNAEPIPPLTALQNPIDRVIETLRDPQFQTDAQKAMQHEKIRSIIDEVFDFKAIAMRAVGRNWRRFSTEEKKAFVDIFSELLSNTYIGKMQGEFKNEQVSYIGADAKGDSKSLVKTMIIRDTLEIPVSYSMRLRNDSWKVYDVNIEGVSLVKNYRTQFNKILINKKPADLIAQVAKKVNNLKE